MRQFLLLLFLFSLSSLSRAQVKPFDSAYFKGSFENEEISRKSFSSEVLKKEYDPSPIRSGLYSTVIPGFGQLYNRSYWKVPLVWVAIGTSVWIMVYNEKRYKQYHNAFLAELKGLPHEFSGYQGVDLETLAHIQNLVKRDRDYAIAFSIGFYVLNILDAVVDAHLYQLRRDPDLTVKPLILEDVFGKNQALGINLGFRF